MWRLGRVVAVTDRRVRIEQVLKSGTKTILERNPRDVSIIAGVDELAVNTQDYFDKIVAATSKSLFTVHHTGGLKQVEL